MIPALMPIFARQPIAFTHGEGAWLFAEDGRRHLDFGAGIATSSLGHNHAGLVGAIAAQAARVIHVSNLYRVPQAETLAQRLVDASFADSAFFCNSGAEANEGLVKLLRRAMAETGRGERHRIICFEGAFHGRTLATLAATGNAKYLQGFGPVTPGFDHVPLHNMNALRDAIGPETAAVLIEPIQGEGGVRVVAPEFLRAVRAACDEFGIYLGMDEVQSGMGRTGRLFAHEWSGIVPDALSVAKGIAGGFPMGAVLARENVAQYLTPGSHGTTFGGNPLACAAGNAVLDVVLAPGFLAQIGTLGAQLHAGLVQLCARHPDILAEARGMGLLAGLQCRMPAADLALACRDEGLLVVGAGENVIRLIPPLIIGTAEIETALAMLDRAARRCRAAGLAAAS